MAELKIIIGSPYNAGFILKIDIYW